MAPTRIYVKNLLQLIREVDVRALSHITGGGLPENIPPRVLPKGTIAALDTQSWELPPPVFQWLQNAGGVAGRKCIAPLTAVSAWSSVYRKTRRHWPWTP